MYTIVYHEHVVKKDIPAIPSVWRIRVRAAIEKKLTRTPELFAQPLRGSLKGYRKLRVGTYRVVCRIEAETVFVLTIRHRSEGYAIATKRVR